jgi:hypothetical protein
LSRAATSRDSRASFGCGVGRGAVAVVARLDGGHFCCSRRTCRICVVTALPAGVRLLGRGAGPPPFESTLQPPPLLLLNQCSTPLFLLPPASILCRSADLCWSPPPKSQCLPPFLYAPSTPLSLLIVECPKLPAADVFVRLNRPVTLLFPGPLDFELSISTASLTSVARKVRSELSRGPPPMTMRMSFPGRDRVAPSPPLPSFPRSFGPESSPSIPTSNTQSTPGGTIVSARMHNSPM